MSESDIKLLPFEFARSNGLLLRELEGDLVLSPEASQWAISEVIRTNSSFSAVTRIDDESFEKMLSSIYSGRENSSESVMEDIKDFVDMESAAA